MDIKDNHKRRFALGFKYLFDRQKKMNQSELARLAKVQPAAITSILRAYEDRFPGVKAQNRIAKSLDIDIYTITDIGKQIEEGKTIEFDVLEIKGVKPKHSDPEVQKIIERFKMDSEKTKIRSLSVYEQQIIIFYRIFKKDPKLRQEFYDYACDLFLSYQSKILRKLKKF